MSEELDRSTEPGSEAAPSSPAFSPSRYRFTTGVRAGEKVTIRGDDDAELLSYRSFASVVGIVAIVVSVVVLVTGAAAVTFLAAEGRAVPAIAAAVLSGGFAVVIAMLVPPTNVTLYEDALPAVQISQESNVSFPSVTFVVATPDRRVLARFHKSVWSRLARNRWSIVNASDRPVGFAIEESLSRALLRKVAGKFSRHYEANLHIDYHGKDVGTILRRGAEDVLELHGDIDRRVAVALATLILGSEP